MHQVCPKERERKFFNEFIQEINEKQLFLYSDMIMKTVNQNQPIR